MSDPMEILANQILAERGNAAGEMRQAERIVSEFRAKIEAFDRSLELIERARKAQPAAAPPPARAERGSVQTAVMECFGDNVKASSADDMCFRLTQFDRSSVLSALRALVKSGKLILADGRYRVAEAGA